MSNINDYTKLEDNRLKQSGLRAHTSFKNGWHLGNKMAEIIFFFFSKIDSEMNKENLKMKSGTVFCNNEEN